MLNYFAWADSLRQMVGDGTNDFEYKIYGADWAKVLTHEAAKAGEVMQVGSECAPIHKFFANAIS